MSTATASPSSVRGASSAPADFFARMLDAHAAAESRAGAVRRRLRLCGADMEMRFAGPAAVGPLTRALAHAAVADDSPPAGGLTVRVWDSASTGTPPPPLPEGSLLRGAEIVNLTGGPFRTACSFADGALWMINFDAGSAVVRVRDAAGLSAGERAAPLRVVLHWWLGARGVRLVHAAAIGLPEGGVLIAGKGGSGKSTTAGAAVLAGLQFAGDDYVLVTDRPAPYAATLYSTAKLNARSLRLLPEWSAAADDGPVDAAGKSVVFVGERFPQRVPSGFPIRAVLAAQVGGGRRTRLRTISPAAALLALAPSSLCQLPGGAARSLESLAALVRRVPTYRLELGDDVADVVAVVAGAVRGDVRAAD